MTTYTLSRVPMAPAVKEKPEALFRSAHAALVYALNYSMQQYDRPLMNKAMSGKPEGEGKGLSGVDGAGQAGMIRAELARLAPLHQAVLVASIAPQQVPCECRAACCGGWKTNPEWSDAVSELTTVAAAAALAGCVSNGRLRSGLIQRLLGAKATLADLAARHDVDEKTAGAHSAKLKRWLFGGGGGAAGLHQQASRILSDRLQASGMIHGADAVD
ncbi:hypothetical protein [Achromobacter marplatensis]|uniref:hypothetical protein n=1 Tax=Achromobacter marplatensis TaxID=470868 RepID=UPI0028E491EF|nr:hypothetical protein [Achromobacter marplatensis]